MTVSTVVGRRTPLEMTFLGLDQETGVAVDGAVNVACVLGGVPLVDVARVDPNKAGHFYWNLPGTAELGLVTVTWSATVDGEPVTETTQVDVRGGMLLELSDVRAADTVLENAVKYPASRLLATIWQVQEEFEGILGFRLTGKRETVWVNGLSSIALLPSPYAQSVQAVDGLTPGDLAKVWTNQAGLLTLPRQMAGRYTVTYTHGLSSVPADIAWAAKKRIAYLLTAQASGIPDRATTYTATEGGTYSLSTPGRAGAETGIPDVDAVLKRYIFVRPGIA